MLRFGFTLVAVSFATFVHAQPNQPTEAYFKSLQERFGADRAEAVNRKFPEVTLERADETAKRAKVAAESGAWPTAVKLIREARWQIPYIPADLPPHVERVLGLARLRHGDKATGVAFSPDSSKLASCSEDSTVKIWDMGNGRELRTYRGSKEKVQAIVWSKDGRMIASSSGLEIHLWDPDTGKLIRALTGHEKDVVAVAISPDGSQIASGSLDRSVRLWNVKDGKLVGILNADLADRQRSTINAVAFSPNGKLVAAVNGNGQLQIWNPSLEKGKQLVMGLDAHQSQNGYQVSFGKDSSVIFTAGSDKRAKQFVGVGPNGESLTGSGKPVSFEGHTESVASLAISPDARYMATAGIDRSIRLWDLHSGKTVRVFQGHSDDIVSLAFSPDGMMIASASHDQSVRLWPVSTSDDHLKVAEQGGSVWSAAFSPDGRQVASGGSDKVILLQDAVNGKVIRKLEGHTAPVTALAYSNDGTMLISGSGDRTVRIWDPRTGAAGKVLSGHQHAVMALAISMDGKQVFTGGVDKRLLVWNTAEDQAVFKSEPFRSPISSLAVRKDGKQVLVGTADGTLRVFGWDGRVAKEIGSIPAHNFGIGSLAYQPDGTRAASCGGDGLVRLWTIPTTPAPDAKTGPSSPVLVMEFKGHNKPLSSVAFNDDGRLVVSAGGDSIVRIWDTVSRTELKALRGHGDWVASAMFAPNGRSILTAGVDRTVRIWELSANETTKPIGHSRRLNTISVSGDGKLVATGSADRTIKIWDAQAGLELYTLDASIGGHDFEITALAFSPDGKRLISGAGDNKMIIWDLTTRKPVSAATIDLSMPYMMFSADGKKYVVWQNKKVSGNTELNQIKTYDPTGKELGSLDVKDRPVSCVSFSADGDTAVLGYADGSLQVWKLGENSRVGGDITVFEKDLKDLGITPKKDRVIGIDGNGQVQVYDIAAKSVVKKVQGLKPAESMGLTVSPDGRYFVTYSGAGEVRLWSADKVEEVRSWSLPTPVYNLAFSSDGKKLLTANGDTTLYVLNLP